MLDSLLHNTVRLPFATGNGIRFARARLAVRENRTVSAFESRALYNVFDLSKRILLHRIFAKNRRKLKVFHLVAKTKGDYSIVLDTVASLAVRCI